MVRGVKNEIKKTSAKKENTKCETDILVYINKDFDTDDTFSNFKMDLGSDQPKCDSESLLKKENSVMEKEIIKCESDILIGEQDFDTDHIIYNIKTDIGTDHIMSNIDTAHNINKDVGSDSHQGSMDRDCGLNNIEADVEYFNTAPLITPQDDGRHFILPYDLWSTISPVVKIYGGRGVNRRRMSGNWTNVFAENVSRFYPGCALKFKKHRVKMENSRKVSAPFMAAIAVCKGESCSGIFEFVIHKEPMEQQEVQVTFNVSGSVFHHMHAVNKKYMTGTQRSMVGEKIPLTSSTDVFSKHSMRTPSKQMELESLTSVPTLTQTELASETIQQDYPVLDIVREIVLLKESYNGEEYIQEIGLDPFTLVLFSKNQIRLIESLSIKNSLDIYVDSTGSVIKPISGQEQPYLYSVVVKPNEDIPPVSVGDMLTTEHTYPRIEYFLATLIEAVRVEGTSMRVRKVETSFALLQACLGQFCTASLRTYLTECFGYSTNRNLDDTDFTCVHICAAHTLNNFKANLKNLKRQIKNPVRYALIQAFAALQNATSLQQAKTMYHDMCVLFLSKHITQRTEKAKLNITSKQSRVINEDDFGAFDEVEIPETTDELEMKTIKNDSPFTAAFRKIKEQVLDSEKDLAPTSTNEYYYPEVILLLEEIFIPIIPLWTGMLLTLIDTDDSYKKTRDSNINVGNWFKFIKRDRKMLRMKPPKFVVDLKRAVDGRLLELAFSKVRKPGTQRRKNLIDLEEELWGNNSIGTAKQPKYDPSEMRIKLPTNLPPAMKWGDHVEGIDSSNTCSIENGLTIINMFWREHDTFKALLQKHSANVFKLLESVMLLMSRREFSAAKRLWVTTVNKPRIDTDVVGDEYGLVFHEICQEWVSRTTSCCPHPCCLNPTRELEDERGGVTVGMPDSFTSMQHMIDKWLDDTEPCSDCNKEDETMCKGTRRVRRTLWSTAPILVARVYEECLYSRLVTKDILDSQELTVGKKRYLLAGLTLHKDAHYCAIVKFGDCFCWYDGSTGRFDNLPIASTIDLWFPSHVIYCEMEDDF